jgi:hypothetical protein
MCLETFDRLLKCFSRSRSLVSPTIELYRSAGFMDQKDTGANGKVQDQHIWTKNIPPGIFVQPCMSDGTIDESVWHTWLLRF